MINDIILYISHFCDFKTRVNLKKSNKLLFFKINLSLIQHDSIIDVNFIENIDNCYVLFEYFYRTYVKPYENHLIEPYFHINMEKVIYAKCVGEIIYSEIIKDKFTYFSDIQMLWFGFSEGKYNDGEIWRSGYTYTSKELWQNIFKDATDGLESCYIYKINPSSPRINGNIYNGRFYDYFNEDCILDIY